ncbi:MAG: hypothetical protein U5N86_02535 [Planctomycetota bacterium]|nr:hypothetical protein [Planctomycetota bacterium]
MSRVRTGWLIAVALLAIAVVVATPSTARAEASWTEGFEIYFDQQPIGTPWAPVSAFADGQTITPYNGIIAAHLGDSQGSYSNGLSHRLSRSVDVVYSGTQFSFWASYAMADAGDYAVFEYSTDGGFTWTILWGPISSTALVDRTPDKVR